MTNGDRHCKFRLDIRKTASKTGQVNAISIGVACHLSQFNTFEKLIEDIRWFVRRARKAHTEEWRKKEYQLSTNSILGISLRERKGAMKKRVPE